MNRSQESGVRSQEEEPDIRVRLGDTSIRLDLDTWEWQPESGPAADALAETANLLSGSYEYSPAHGEPGYQLAHDVAKKLEARAELPPLPPLEPGALY
jgi:hypothetical protein